MEDYNKYLQGEYEGNEDNKRLQEDKDIERAKEIEEEIKMAQDATFEHLIEDYSANTIENVEDFNRLYNTYNTQDLYGEYLIDGAILQCTKATLEDFYLSNGEKIVLNKLKTNNKEKQIQMTLYVRENETSIQKKCYATVKDSIKGLNIICPRCNCMVPANRKSEEDKIIEDKESAIFGVCKHLMCLNEQWDNMPLGENRKYMTVKNKYIKELTPDSKVEDMSSAYFETEYVEGITMTSILFCKHGGLIYPVTSGQENLVIGSYLNDEEMLFIATIYGEASGCNESSWLAIANTIMNRVQSKRFKYNSASDVIKYSGFDAYGSSLYNDALTYLNNRDGGIDRNDLIEHIIEVVMPVYIGVTEDITEGVVLFYSTETQKAAHKKNPQKYKEVPDWNWNELEEVIIPGSENDDFRFFRYK